MWMYEFSLNTQHVEKYRKLDTEYTVANLHSESHDD